VDAVFNLELPSSAAHYAHRAGRTGRMGAPGLVISLVAPGERFVIERLSKKLGVPVMVRACVCVGVCLGPAEPCCAVLCFDGASPS
jgi:superfamily II DNA/RNA helicase